jgi:hypothetical protein
MALARREEEAMRWSRTIMAGVIGCAALTTAIQGFGDESLVRRSSGRRVVPVEKLTAADAAAGDLFGFCPDVDGDVAVIGARHADHSGLIDPGAAYVFHRIGSTWTEMQKLVAPDAEDDDYFGQWVAVDGDTILVSAVHDDHSGFADAGSVYVFTRSGDTWDYQQKLIASDPGAGLRFGWCPTIDGDTLVTSSDVAGTQSEGAAYVFTRTGGIWDETQILVSSDAGPNDAFGSCSDVDGQLLVVGAGSHDPAGATNGGAAYVFLESGGLWTEHQKLITSDVAPFDGAGGAVAMSGETIVLNAPGADHSSHSNAGAAYVFIRDGDLWVEQQKLIAGDPSDNAWGWFIDIRGDTVVIGAHLTDLPGLPDAGAAYAFHRSNGIWTEVQKYVSPEPQEGENFGWTVPISGDTVITGAPWNDHTSMTDPGAAYVLRLWIFLDGFESGDTTAWSSVVP